MNAIQQEAIATLDANRAALAACTDNALILAWDNGLGVKFGPNSTTRACRLDIADEVAFRNMPEDAWAYVPVVTNGAGVHARLIPRQDAIKAQLVELDALIANLLSRWAE